MKSKYQQPWLACVLTHLNLEEKMNVIHFEEQSSDEKENAFAEW